MSPKSSPPRSASRPAGGSGRPARPAGPSTSGLGSSARAKLAAQRELEERRRRRLRFVVLPLVVVVVAAAALVGVRALTRGSATPAASGAAGNQVVQGVTSVPAGVLDQVGVGTVRALPKSVDAPALTADGKPKILYVGAEYCPYCAAERWAVVAALSRFGTFSGLGQTASSSTDVYPSTPTLTFHGASFTSPTVAFTGVETEDGASKPLDTLTAEDQQTFSTYNSPPYVDAQSQGSIPFVDIGGKYLVSGASYDPQVLQGKTHEQVAAALSDPTSDIAKAVDGTANAVTAAICASTKNAPSAVCTSAGVQAAAKQLS